MKFATKKDCKAWVDTNNSLGQAVERACIPYEKRLHASQDARCRDLARFIYKLSERFKDALNKELNRVWDEWEKPKC